MTKKVVFWVSFIFSLIGFIFSSDRIYTYCYQDGHCWQLWDFINSIGFLFFFFISIFILSLITYFLKEQVFRTWLHFAYGWIPLSLLFVYIASQSSGGGFGIPNVFDTESVSMIFSVLFFIISLILIFIKSIMLRKEK